ncbi:AAA family ATPase [Nakamurella sp.]|uniref:helix-turn-helix transcriptional regulator n=1 Tax=Nakamurella sp. TaxID=1869182 RepID=UPI0037835CE5
MQAFSHTNSFVGRTAELAVLKEELAATRSGSPRVVLIEGPAGIGKSAIIDRLLAAEPDLTVLRAAGERWEAFVAFGVVDQLMRSTKVSRARLLADRQRSLPVEEPVGVGQRVLEAIEDLEATSPVVLVVDDVHWADLDSLRALLFVTRRLVDARVLTLLAERPEDAQRLPEGLRRLADGRTGRTIALAPLPAADIPVLAGLLGVPAISGRAARRLYEHTGGNPLYITSLLSEVPQDRWKSWEPVLPAPRTFAAQVIRRIEACSPPARRLVESAAVLGAHATLADLAEMAGVEEIIPALEEATELNLLRLVDDEPGLGGVTFVHPLVRAAVHGRLGPARLVDLHLAAARLVQDEAAALHHRVMAATQPDPELVEQLSEFARNRAAEGAWATAASAFLEAARLSGGREDREQLLLKAVDAMIGAGDLQQAEAFAEEFVGFQPNAMSQATQGYLAVLRGRLAEADELLRAAWESADSEADPGVAAVVCQRLALHAVGRLQGSEVARWSRRAIDMSSREDPVRVEAEALLGLGLGLHGDLAGGLRSYEAVRSELTRMPNPPPDDRVRMATGWLRLVDDDVVGARAILAPTAAASFNAGNVRIAVWSYVWLAHTDFALGAWDDATAPASRAVSLLQETGHEWLRPLAHLAAILVPAARGAWTAAEEHAQLAGANPGDYELMQVAAGLARAHLAVARADHEGVLRALEPVVDLALREGVDEPGFWPWQDLYGDALVSAGRLDEVDEFLSAHEDAAARRGRRSMVARLARVRGRWAAARGDIPAAEAAFTRGLSDIAPLPLPFQRALLEFAYGQVLRRAGQRRAAAHQLQGARDRFSRLQARPYLDRCDRELAACGLAPAKRSTFDPSRLTAQESAVARLVAMGMGNRQVASELFISIKTVQFHLTHIYAKLNINSRAELAAQFRDVEGEEEQDPGSAG